MSKCFEVFNTWDEEYDKFAAQLRDMSKKKREETLKFAWRANPAHKKLQERISRMRQCAHINSLCMCAKICPTFSFSCFWGCFFVGMGVGVGVGGWVRVCVRVRVRVCVTHCILPQFP